MYKFQSLIVFVVLFICSTELMAQIGRALVFDGCTDYFEILNEEPLDYNETLSIECWVLPNCNEGNNIILSKQWCSGEYGYYLSVNNRRLFWSFAIHGGCPNNSVVQSVNQVIPTDQFSHVAVVHSQTEVHLYVNGQRVITEYTKGNFGAIHNSSEPFRIGAYQNVSRRKTNFFSGLVDELRVWNTRLDETLIRQRMNRPLQGDELGLILYLNMEKNARGASLILENQSLIGSSLDALPNGFTALSPYTIPFEEYVLRSLKLEDELVVCSFPDTIALPEDNYKNITWSTGSQDTETIVSEMGFYSVEVETELCKIFSDSVFVSIETIHTGPIVKCENESILVNGQIIDAIGNYQQKLVTSQGCDSLVNFSVVERSIIEIDESYFFCKGESIELYGISYDTEGNYQERLTSVQSCDTILNINLTARPIIEINRSYTFCHGEFIDINGVVYDSGGNYQQTLKSNETCDTLLNISLEKSPLIEVDRSYTFCQGEFIDINNVVYDKEGNYQQIISSNQACDTILNLSLIAEIESFYVPNVFCISSEQNDFFQPMFPINQPVSFEMQVFDRWGNVVFVGMNTAWNGKINTNYVEQGVYVYKITLDNNCAKNTFIGNVTFLLRL